MSDCEWVDCNSRTGYERIECRRRAVTVVVCDQPPGPPPLRLSLCRAHAERAHQAMRDGAAIRRRHESNPGGFGS